jgi:hypothetical protein
MHKHCHNNSSTNKQCRDAQTRERGGFAVFRWASASNCSQLFFNSAYIVFMCKCSIECFCSLFNSAFPLTPVLEMGRYIPVYHNETSTEFHTVTYHYKPTLHPFIFFNFSIVQRVYPCFAFKNYTGTSKLTFRTPSDSDYVASNESVIIEWWIGRMWEETVVVYFLRHYLGMCLQGMRKTTEILSQDSRPRYEPRTTRIWRRSVNHSTTTFGGATNGMAVNDDLERMWKKAVVVCFMELCQCFLRADNLRLDRELFPGILDYHVRTCVAQSTGTLDLSCMAVEFFSCLLYRCYRTLWPQRDPLGGFSVCMWGPIRATR